ncbi:hypothetical protein MFIFM68171_07427 [Madurella fahalii]|uniref:F-box domain-containing protein n=1 Tax=Madurella fahalii TaxID=1157608 RepID=A0ABQ0GHK6_9PEZI
MGTWDSYCAICGGPFYGLQFKRARRQAHPHAEANSQEPDESDREDEQVPGEDDQSEANSEESDDDHENLDSDLSDGEQSDSVSVHDPIALSDSDTDSDEFEDGPVDWDISSVSEQAEDDNQLSLADSLLSATDGEDRGEANDETLGDGNDSDLSTEDPDLEFRYNPDVIRRQDTRWTSAMYGLCYNKDAAGPSKTFLAPGRATMHGNMHIRPGPRAVRDPNYPGRKPRIVDCYSHSEEDYGFPLHAACLELFTLYVVGRRVPLKQLLRGHNRSSNSNRNNNNSNSPRGLDKDALYFALRLMGEACFANLPISYGDLVLADAQQWWESRRGHECLVAYPGVSGPDGPDKLDKPNDPDDPDDPAGNPVTAFLRAHVARSGGYARSFLTADLSPKVGADPFGRLPYDMIYRISHFLDDKSLLSLCSASWVVHCALRGNDRFWRHRIRRVSMPWLEEVVPLLRDDELMKGVDVKGLLCALDGLTQLRAGMTGPMMGVANRRRIWGVCRIIAKTYKKMVARTEAMGSEAVMEQLINASYGRGPAWLV